MIEMITTRLAIKLTLFWGSRDPRGEPKQAYSHDPHLKFQIKKLKTQHTI